MTYFLFGSLRHLPLLAAVLGREVFGPLTPAELEGARPVYAGPSGPATLAPDAATRTEGVLLDGVTETEADRLHYFAAVHGCRPETRQVAGASVTVFMADVPGDARPFLFAGWQAAWAPLWVLAAEEVMAQYGRWPGEGFGAHRLKAVHTRAAALLRAPDRPRPSRFDLDRDIAVKARHLPYLNFFSLAEIDLRYRQFDGSMGPEMNRAALRVGDAAIVLPYDPVRDCVLLIQQFRAAPYVAGDTDPWIWEAPAGLVDPGETPQQAAFREAQEEAHIRLSRLEPVTQAYSSTGSSTEFAHIFVGIADLAGAGVVAGVEAEGEDICSEVISFDQFQADLQTGRFVNLQLVTAGLWLALNRERLRGTG
ncbi:MAG: tellurium resistance protein [Rhodobacteraceae bacterium]|nr:tellurium resistance protein [Paracoccaceae bacterium]